MKISDNSEMRIIAEETIVNMFHELETELAQLKERCLLADRILINSAEIINILGGENLLIKKYFEKYEDKYGH